MVPVSSLGGLLVFVLGLRFGARLSDGCRPENKYWIINVIQYFPK